MARVEVPPPVGSSGQFIDAVVITSSTLRQINVIGGAVTSGVFAPVTAQGLGVVSASSGLVQISGTAAIVSASSGLVQISGSPTVLTASSGYLVRSLSSGTVTLSSAIALSSGIVTLSSVPTVTATAATNPWSSAPGFNVPVVNASSGLVQISGVVTVLSASSGLVQISGTPSVTIVGTSGAIAPATSSGGLGVTILAGSGSGSTAINIVGTSGAIAPATSSGGLAVTIVAGSGAGSTAVNIVGSSNAIAPVTSSGGLGVTILAGSGSGSTAVNIIGTSSAIAPVTSSGGMSVTIINPTTAVSLSSATALSSGTVTLSSAPLVIVATSGGNIPVTLSSAPLVIVATSGGTIDVNVPSTKGMSVASYVSSSSGNSNLILADGAAWYGYALFNSTGTIRYVHFYQTSSAPGVGTTANWIGAIAVPGSTAGGGGANLISGGKPMNYSTKGLGFTMTDNPSSTGSTVSQSAGDSLITIFYSA